MDSLLKDDYKGGTSKLSKEQESQLKKHLESRVYPDAKSIAKYIEETYGITYTPEGLVHLLHRLGFVYKKSKQVTGYAEDRETKGIYLSGLIKESKKKRVTMIRFTLQMAHICATTPCPSLGGYREGKVKELLTNTGRKRININGAIDVSTLDFIYREDATINSDSTIGLLTQPR